jgi:hypothetical protein
MNCELAKTCERFVAQGNEAKERQVVPVERRKRDLTDWYCDTG